MPNAGTKTIEVTSSNGATGSYELRLSQCRVAGSMAIGDSITSTLQSTDCPVVRGDSTSARRTAFMTFHGTAGDSIQIDMMAGWDTYLFLFTPDGQFRTLNDDGGSGTNSRISIVLPSDGTYLIAPSSYSSSFSGGDFQLQVTRFSGSPLLGSSPVEDKPDPGPMRP